jgi:hypothetical protein
MSPLRIIQISVNLALLAAFWPLTNELLSSDASDLTAYKPSSVLSRASRSWPEQPELTRPLFRGGPSPAGDDDRPLDVGSGPNIRLLGIVLADERRVAVLERDGASLRVEEGDDLDRWHVTRIERRKIRLESSEQQIDVLLDTTVDPH